MDKHLNASVTLALLELAESYGQGEDFALLHLAAALGILCPDREAGHATIDFIFDQIDEAEALLASQDENSTRVH